MKQPEYANKERFHFSVSNILLITDVSLAPAKHNYRFVTQVAQWFE